MFNLTTTLILKADSDVIKDTKIATGGNRALSLINVL